MKRLSFLLMFVLFWGVAHASDEILLFGEKGQVHPEYHKILDKIKSGEKPVLAFHTSDGIKRYQVRHWLDSGSLTEVISVDHDKVLYLPRRFGRDPMLQRGTVEQMLGRRLAEYSELHENGVNTVKIFENESVPNRVIVAEEVMDRIGFNDLANEMIKLKKLGTPVAMKQYQEYLKAMEEFVRSTWRYKVFGDLREDQVLYSKKTKKMILVDWDEGSLQVTYRNQGTIFSSDASDMMRSMHQMRGDHVSNTYAGKLELMDKQLQNDLDRAIYDERTRHGLVDSPSCFKSFSNLMKRVFNR